MKTINFAELFTERGVAFTTDGQHSSGNIGVSCPFCRAAGDPDPSDHLGINLRTGAWSCWRDPSHRGRKPHSLLFMLLGMPRPEVDALIGASGPTQEEFEKFCEADDPFAEKKAFYPTGLTAKSKEVIATFVRMGSGFAAPHRAYFESRGMGAVTAEKYGIMAGVVSSWHGRVIIPIYRDGVIISWQGRKIDAGMTGPKYMALITATAVDSFGGVNIKHAIFDHDRVFHNAAPDRTLVVVEGVMDAINLSQYSEGEVTCVFGTSMSEEQAALIWQAAEQYQRVVFLFDKGALPQAIKAAAGFEKAEAIPIEWLGVNDPGEITMDNIEKVRALKL